MMVVGVSTVVPAFIADGGSSGNPCGNCTGSIDDQRLVQVYDYVDDWVPTLARM